MPRPLKRGVLGASTIILSKDVGKYAFMCGSNFYESDVRMGKYKIETFFLKSSIPNTYYNLCIDITKILKTDS